MRGEDILEAGCGYRNTSLIWGPTDAVSVLFTWLTPDFMKVVPAGASAGQAKFWPLFYLIPGCLLYFTLLPLLLCLLWEWKHIKEDFIKVKLFFKNLRKPKVINENINNDKE